MTVIATESETFTLAGRTFGPAIPQTPRMRLYYTKHFHAAGLDRLNLDWVNDYAGSFDKIQTALCDAEEEGAYLMAAVLVEQGKTWNKADAIANANFFLDLTEPADLDEFTEAMKLLLLSFFLGAVPAGREPGPLTGTRSSATSPSSLATAPENGSPTEDTLISLNGPISGSSVTTTPTA